MKSIIGYSNYLVSEFGDVKNLKTNRVLKPHLRKDGYKYVCLYKNGVGKKHAIHRIVCLNFNYGIGVSNLVVNHKDGNKLNNHYLNLELCTLAENNTHAWEIGLHKRGERHHLSKISDLDLNNIRKLYKEGMTQNKIADKFNINQSVVSRYINKKRGGAYR